MPAEPILPDHTTANRVTDRERLLALLDDFGIKPDRGDYLPSEYRSDSYVVLSEGEGGVLGYDCYFCAFRFDTNGRFVSVEIRE